MLIISSFCKKQKGKQINAESLTGFMDFASGWTLKPKYFKPKDTNILGYLTDIIYIKYVIKLLTQFNV